jgi:resuscitation-promoting factor RpfB
MKNGFLLAVLLTFAFLLGCTAKSENPIPTFSVLIQADGKEINVPATVGQTVQQVLSDNGIILNNLDRVEPPTYSVLNEVSSIHVIRVTEKFESVETSIPFERQTVQNESLKQGQTLLIQAGENGKLQSTYRIVSEDGKETSRTIFSQTIVKSEVPEITMIGIQAISNPVTISGKIAYIIAGNAWIMEGTTGNRRSLVTSGDLDGYVFSLSLDGEWLLFSRHSLSSSQMINTLWLINTAEGNNKPIDLKISNVIRSTQWIPNHQLMFSYTTVEPRNSAPGWQANNDLWIFTLNPDGTPAKNEQSLDSNSGGLYGWWGIQYLWSSNGQMLAYSLPDQIGVVDFTGKKLQLLVSILPYNSHGDWAWLPSLTWSADNSTIYFVNHESSKDASDPESSPIFHLYAVLVSSQKNMKLVDNVGMFATPSAENQINLLHTSVLFFKAIFPDQSATSRYHLAIMGQDGSNQKIIFPSEGMEGMEPKPVVWSPIVAGQNSSTIALLYKGNLWFLDLSTGESQQITGDGLINVMDWK